MQSNFKTHRLPNTKTPALVGVFCLFAQKTPTRKFRMGVIGELLVLFLFGSFSFFGSFKCFKACIDEHVVPAKHFLDIVCIDAFVIKFGENSSEVFADLGFVTQCFYVNFLPSFFSLIDSNTSANATSSL